MVTLLEGGNRTPRLHKKAPPPTARSAGSQLNVPPLPPSLCIDRLKPPWRKRYFSDASTDVTADRRARGFACMRKTPQSWHAQTAAQEGCIAHCGCRPWGEAGGQWPSRPPSSAPREREGGARLSGLGLSLLMKSRKSVPRCRDLVGRRETV